MKAERFAMAANALLFLDPSNALPVIERACTLEGKTFLRSLRSLREGSVIPVRYDSWRAPDIERLTALLFEHFPPQEDPDHKPGVAYNVGWDDELRRLRDRLPQYLMSRSGGGDHDALERLGARFSTLKRWYEHEKASRVATGVMSYVEGGSTLGLSSEGHVPLSEVLRVVGESTYRVFRSASQLQAILSEELLELGKDSGEHLAMLYHPRPKAKGQKRSRLHEDALQAYVACRLKDRLIGRVIRAGSSIIANREALSARDHRTDIKIEAPRIGGGTEVVVIEIKWSDNKDVATALIDQLGMDYLQKNNLTHGIYLVGWNGTGKWKSRLGARPKGLSEWQVHFEGQASVLAGGDPALFVEVSVFDLRWDHVVAGD